MAIKIVTIEILYCNDFVKSHGVLFDFDFGVSTEISARLESFFLFVSRVVTPQYVAYCWCRNGHDGAHRWQPLA